MQIEILNKYHLGPIVGPGGLYRQGSHQGTL